MRDGQGHHIIPIVVNKTRSYACKLLASLTSESGFFFFLTFRKKWVGRAMGNETFYWDGLFIFLLAHFAEVLRQPAWVVFSLLYILVPAACFLKIFRKTNKRLVKL